ncbi:MAG: peptidoglycan-binding protein [Defluviitaleaceae bacterium]|nr:peptidoglycan-binding protein [Defluviitaleaceae bacterium]
MGTGYLKVATTSANGNLPVQANIIISLEDQILHDIHTNKRGITEKVPLEAPPKELALDPDYTGIPYSTYSVRAQADGFATQIIHGVRIFDTIVSILPINMTTDWENDCDEYFIPTHKLIEPTLPEAENPAGLPLHEEAIIPGFVNINSKQVPFIDYIQKIASNTIYPTWPPAAIEANIYAIITQALHKLDEQSFIEGGQTHDNIAHMVSSIFNRYIQHEGNPFFPVFSDGRKFTCPGLWQWGTVALAERGHNALEILRHYYPGNVEIVETNNIDGIAPFPGYSLQEGMKVNYVQLIQTMLNNIRRFFPDIPEITSVDGSFGPDTTIAVNAFQRIFMPEIETGIVDKNTWYRISIIHQSYNQQDNVSSNEKLLAKMTKEHINTSQLLTMFMLSQMYNRHAGCYI